MAVGLATSTTAATYATTAPRTIPPRSLQKIRLPQTNGNPITNKYPTVVAILLQRRIVRRLLTAGGDQGLASAGTHQ